jgi:hypothetical protein
MIQEIAMYAYPASLVLLTGYLLWRELERWMRK